MQANKLKLNILHKGLILLFVPFVLQAILFVSLFTQISAAEKEAEVQQLRADAIEKCTALIEDFGWAWTSIFNHVFAGKEAEKYSLSPEEYKERVTRALTEMREMPSFGPRVERLYKGVELVRDKQYVLLKQMDAENQQTTDFNLIRVMSQLRTIKKDLLDTFRQMNQFKSELDAERQDVEMARREGVKRRQSIRQQSVYFLMFELLLTGLLLAFFLKNISKRLNDLVGNARLLPTEEPLVKRVEGEDEIAYLDGVLHEASDRLIESKKNRQAIMNMIAHDIRSPLTSSNIMLDLVVRHAESGAIEKARETGARLRDTYQQMLALVEDFLALEKVEVHLTLSPEMFDIAYLVSAVLASLQPQADKKSVTLKNSISSRNIIADRVRIHQVLSNLVSNAIKYGGKEVEVSALEKENFFVVSVTDDGQGIAPEAIPHLFEKFFQVKDADQHQGFGLGLSIVKLIVENHGGQVGVDSQLGKGTNFWFSLPTDSL